MTGFYRVDLRKFMKSQLQGSIPVDPTYSVVSSLENLQLSTHLPGSYLGKLTCILHRIA